MTRARASLRRLSASLGLTLAALACAHEPAPDASRPSALVHEPATPAAPEGPLASRYKRCNGPQRLASQCRCACYKAMCRRI